MGRKHVSAPQDAMQTLTYDIHSRRPGPACTHLPFSAHANAMHGRLPVNAPIRLHSHQKHLFYTQLLKRSKARSEQGGILPYLPHTKPWRGGTAGF